MTADKIIEVYKNIEKKPYDAIRNEFIQHYSPKVLQNLEGTKLAERLFTGKEAESDIGIRGLFVWLEHGKSGKVPKGTFGYARDSAFQNGILLYYDKTTDKRSYNLYFRNQGKKAIDGGTAINYANDIKDVICKVYALMDATPLNSIEEYRKLESEIKKLCSGKANPYWTSNGELKPSLLKYFHILFPNKLSEFYSKSYIHKVTDLLEIKQEQYISDFCLSGAIMIYMKELDRDMDGVYFAQAIYSVMGQNEENQNTDEKEENEVMRNTKENELNLILYGPPGTGKTYNTVNYAVAICDNESYDSVSKKPYDEVLKRYKALLGEGRIAFTTFHQSYGYEEFIEGIKPDLDSKEIKYKKSSGVFKEFCNSAKKYLHNESSDDEISEGEDLINPNASVWKISLDSAGRKGFEFHDKCLNDNCIRVGWDEAEDLSLVTEDGKDSARRFMEDMKIGDIVLSCYSQNEIDAIGVVTGDYEWHEDEPRLKRFRQVKWLRKWMGKTKYNILSINGGTTLSQPTVYKLWRISVDGIKKLIKETELHEMSQSVIEEDKKQNCVFIIDEINRGNVSKIFGELITLIEPTKRLGAKEEMKCTLPYSGDRFGVPKNVYLIGTMNTADRSLVQLDAALRRRFAFEEMMPKPELLEPTNDGVDLNKLLTAINKRITALLDREHQIGHSYFMNVHSVNELAYVFKQKIIPLLQEYFFDDYESVRKVLSAAFVDEKDNPFDSGKTIYNIATPIPTDSSEYQKIYNSAVTEATKNE